MKKITVIMLLFLAVTGLLYSEDVIWGSYYSEGNFIPSAGISYDTGTAGPQLALIPGAEIILYKVAFDELAFIDVGAAVKGRIGIPISTLSSFTAGAGAYGTVHFGFRGLDIPMTEYIGNIDAYAGIGLKFDFIPSSVTDALGFAYVAGVNYFLSDDLAVGAFTGSWGTQSAIVGVAAHLKLGETPEVKGLDTGWTEELRAVPSQPYLLQFYTIYYAALAAGGFYPGDYRPGTGAIYRVSSIDSDGESSYMVEKACLEELEGGDLLWMFRWSDDEEEIYYEYVTDSSFMLKTVYYESEDDGLLVMKADEDMYEAYGQSYSNWDDYKADKRENVKIEVKAGTYNTTEYSWEDNSGVSVKWWLSDKVPGSLVSYIMEDDDDILTSELYEVTRSTRARLYK